MHAEENKLLHKRIKFNYVFWLFYSFFSMLDASGQDLSGGLGGRTPQDRWLTATESCKNGLGVVNNLTRAQPWVFHITLQYFAIRVPSLMCEWLKWVSWQWTTHIHRQLSLLTWTWMNQCSFEFLTPWQMSSFSPVLKYESKQNNVVLLT